MTLPRGPLKATYAIPELRWWYPKILQDKVVEQLHQILLRTLGTPFMRAILALTLRSLLRRRACVGWLEAFTLRCLEIESSDDKDVTYAFPFIR